MDQDFKEILFAEEEIQKRVRELGQQISRDYGSEGDLVLICILRGAVVFLADLARSIDRQVTFDFMDVSSYGAGTESSGVVRIIKDLEENIEGQHVLIVEDIIDTGQTLKYVVDVLQTRKPASVKIVTLLDKPERRVTKQVKIDYNGFEIPDEFVVGYGLDYAQKYRNLPFIAVLKPEAYS